MINSVVLRQHFVVVTCVLDCIPLFLFVQGEQGNTGKPGQPGPAGAEGKPVSTT